MDEPQKREIKPQQGFQEKFLSSSADIVIAGGAAGCGKTFSIILDPLRYQSNSAFGAVIFRRTSPQIRNEGGLWDTSSELYPLLGAVPRETFLEWNFPSGSRIKFAHLQYESDKLDWQGSQIAYIGWDELTHFTESQFFYLLSRNRSTCGVKPCVRATCNPDADSWVAKLIEWWIDNDGNAIPERDGIVRWFTRDAGKIVWGDSKEYLQRQYSNLPPESFKSITYIQGDLSENKILNEKDPSYRANLMALPFVERARLLDKNWKIKASSGNVFKRHWFDNRVKALPNISEIEGAVRYWDLSGSGGDGADYSVGALFLKTKDNRFFLADIVRGKWTPLERNSNIRACLERDKANYDGMVMTYLEQVPGIGNEVIIGLVRQFAGYKIAYDSPKGKKYHRAGEMSAQFEVGNIAMLDAKWNEDYVEECLAFSEDEKAYAHDDQVDATSGAFNKVTKARKAGIYG